MVFRNESMLLGIVALVRGNGGSIEGRLKIQKEAYLLSLKGAPQFSPSSFGYKYYGPFSRELSDALQSAVAFGLLNELREDFGEDHSRYTYKLTEDGRQLLNQPDVLGLEEFRDDMDLLKRQRWRTLELAATIAYFESHGQAKGRDEAIEMALRFKPECKAYVKQAKNVLETLGLCVGSYA